MRFAIKLLLAAALMLPAYAAETALDKYVKAPDANYKYELVSKIAGEGYTAYVLDMTSQQWRTAAEVNQPVWRHWLTIVRPDQVSTTTGFLYITGGSMRDKAPTKADAMIATLALATHSVTAELRMVPNEPLVFAGETRQRSEDAIIAYTWDKYLKGGDDQWPLRLPMTKSAVRALDTMTDFSKTAAGGQVDVSKFVVSGGSKRGWTAWTTAAVDRRVIAVAPFVIDLLNIVPSFDHHYRAYGFWAPSVKDYVDEHIMEKSGTPRYKKLMKIEEPYQYRNRLTMPKFMLNAAGDQFFLPDSSQFYYPGLKGEKYLRYVPNTNHSMQGSDARESLQAFYESVVSGTPRPKFGWKFEKDGSIRVHSETKPTEVRLWQATNPKGRDFRMEKIGKAYTSTVLMETKPGVYVGKAAKPAEGFTAYFVEMTYPGNTKTPFKFTSGVRVVPDVLPFPSPQRVK